MPEKNVNEIFIDNLKRLLEEKNVASQSFAKALEISPSTVSMWLTNKSLPRMDLLDKIADYFDVDVVDLYLTQAQQESMLKGFKKGLAQSSNDTTIAAHFGGDEYTEEELEEIRKFAEFIKSKRKDTEE